MDNILDNSKTSIESSSSSIAMRAVSAPLHPPVEAPPVKTQTSAPSYFFSLKDNEAPPFKKPGKWVVPRLLIGTIMNENEAVEMVAASDVGTDYGLKKWLGEFLVRKKIIYNYSLSEKKFLTSLLCELIDYAAQHDFTAFKLAVLITIYLDTHVYFKWHYWTLPGVIWSYFKEIMIRHTIEDSPDGQEVFTPEECYDILTHFHTVYLTNLPLVHIASFGVYKLKLQWPFTPK